MQAFAFQPVRPKSGIFRFECIKAGLRHDLSRHVESARRKGPIVNYVPGEGGGGGFGGGYNFTTSPFWEVNFSLVRNVRGVKFYDTATGA